MVQEVFSKSLHRRNQSCSQWILNVAILYFVFFSKMIQACFRAPRYGGAKRTIHDEDYTWVPPTPNNERDPPTKIKSEIASKIQNAAERNLKASWNGWTPPPHIKKKWFDWLINYQSKTYKSDFLDKFDKESRQKYISERGPDSDWPKLMSWQDLGDGHGGLPAPPWAYGPQNTGIPAACMQAPERGPCNDTILRWGYNGYLEICQNYTWSGCGGSLNRFESKFTCEYNCIVPHASDCVAESSISQDYQFTYDDEN